MEDKIIYESAKGNKVVLLSDGQDCEILLNDMIVVTTGDRFEGEMIAECIDIALSLLDMQGRLK